MLRGINRQNIFENDADYKQFKICLEKVKEVSGLKVYGYCLMSNHVHIVAGARVEPIGTSFKRVGVRYVSWYNRKYDRQGALFQDRYKSEPVEDDEYLLSVLRYLHQNPHKAGICKNVAAYKWSSYGDYVGKGDGLTDTKFVLEIYSKHISEQIRLFEEFTKESNEDEFADIDNVVYVSDGAVRKRITELCGAGSVAEFQALPTDERVCAISMMKGSGISIRKIVRHTGMSFGIVRGIGRG
jgi:REP element-mobilizing transposase RayT